MKYQVSLAEAIQQLAGEEDSVFTTMLAAGTMRVEYYAPLIKDLQTPHTQDELYIIMSGAAGFVRNGEKTDCKKGDVLYVPHGLQHSFIDFTDDFATWVVFYGEKHLH